MIPNTDTKHAIRAYQTQEGQVLLTNGETCWDMTPAICHRNLALFMTELAERRTPSSWPMRSCLWTEYQEGLASGHLELIAELQNPRKENETLSIRTMALEDFAMDAFLIIDTNPNTWEELVAASRDKLEEEQRQGETNKDN